MADDDLPQLTDDEKTALLALLKRTIEDDRYPLSPRISMLRGILAKLEPPKPTSAPLPPLEAYTPPRGWAKQREDDGPPGTKVTFRSQLRAIATERQGSNVS
jgi:hypothetical protein